MHPAPQRPGSQAPHTGWPGGSAGGGDVHFDRLIQSLLSPVVSSPLLQDGGGEGKAGTCPTMPAGPAVCPGPLRPEPPFLQCGQALGIHVGGMGAALGENLGVHSLEWGQDRRLPQIAGQSPIPSRLSHPDLPAMDGGWGGWAPGPSQEALPAPQGMDQGRCRLRHACVASPAPC